MSCWFNEARYGMFVHWGPYSVAARGEWVMNRERIPFKEYRDKYAANFKAQNYDPAAWMDLAKAGGMKYIVLTTRHHDGFAMWDTKTTDFNATRLGPMQDLLTPYVQAAREANLKVGFYYSFADWRHPDYPDAFARDWPKSWSDEAARRRFVSFYKAQLEELFTCYGSIDILWYDGCVPGPTDGDEVNAFVKKLHPGVMINNRNGELCDFWCCEQTIKPAPAGKSWEACMTLNDNWGYHAGDNAWKSPKQVVNLLVQTAAGGGNLLLNVGPMGDGTVPEESAEIIREVGRWLHIHGEFLPDSDRSPFGWFNSGKLTTKGNTIYLHLFCEPQGEFCLSEIKNRVVSARWVHSGERVEFCQEGGRLWLVNLPRPLPSRIDSVIALEVEGEPEPVVTQTTFWIPE